MKNPFEGKELVDIFGMVIIWTSFLCMLCLVIALLMMFIDIIPNMNWPDYAKEHGCEPTDQTVGEIDPKELWICEDGERHWRDI